jgi:hypothetical protein
MSDSRVSIEEIKLAIATTAYCLRRHDMPELLPTLMRFERYLEQRQAEGDAMDHADRALARGELLAEIDAALPAARNSIEKYLDGDKTTWSAA